MSVKKDNRVLLCNPERNKWNRAEAYIIYVKWLQDKLLKGVGIKNEQ